ncbi:VanW family protein [Oscillochloris sp. ZM17-4]|uniref:VanW family protein n=1 Tax=Oscillochloris sp. ZM17-4 TaxID=2866714 RepID=UPI001C73C524|nr:VanW family protein [Oscillochloris sp. ZM17-4]MBX0330374.1 VanW family protein [Oscillochloris sp. ZM17-4]
MPIDDYYQEYGPIRRRRSSQPSEPEEGGPPPEPPPARRPRRRPTRRRRGGWAWAVAILGLLIAAPLALPYALQLYYGDAALPGVSVQGRPVSGLGDTAIAADLSSRYGDFLSRPLSLEYAGRTWQPSLSELGLSLDMADVARQAVSAGRQGDPITRLREIWQIYRGGLDITPRLVADQRVLQGYLMQIAPDIEQPPQDAALSIAAAKVVGTPSAPGVQLLVDATANDVLLAAQALRPQDIAIRTRALPPIVGDTALVRAQSRAAELLQSPVTLTNGDRSWSWPPEKLAELLRVAPDGVGLAVSVDEGLLAQSVEGLAQQLDTGTAEPRLRFSAGQVTIVQEGRPGWRLIQDEAAAQIADLLLTSSPTTRTLELPVEQLTPKITEATIGELGIKELVGEGLSSFSGSAQYRITNIKAGAARMDGVLIAPGEEFSFNRQLGDVDAANGFVEGYAIIGNRTQLEWGGGVCQDSTTVFRAAFWAGLPITERHAHAFYISWYDRFGLGPQGNGQGMDASIYTGVNDLKFVNDTGSWLLMQADVDEVGQVLAVRLYGTKPGREVRLEGPAITNEVRAPSEPVYLDDPSLPAGTVHQSDTARGGRDITVERVITQGGAEVSRDTFFTRFRAWPNIFVRGTGG